MAHQVDKVIQPLNSWGQGKKPNTCPLDRLLFIYLFYLLIEYEYIHGGVTIGHRSLRG